VAVVAEVAEVAVAELPVQEPDDPVVFWFRVGKVQLVSVPEDGVPKAPPLTKLPEAVPVSAAVIVPAEKLPEASRNTIWLIVFVTVAVMVAEFA
jgi:hypothetical protein